MNEIIKNNVKNELVESKPLIGDLRLSIYKVNNALTKLLTESVNEETGEIPEDVLESFESLELAKEEIIDMCAISLHQLNSLASSIENDYEVLEAKRKLELARKYKKTSDSLKNLLSKYIEEGTIIETENYKISWRKSQAVEITDEFLDLAEVEKQYPDLIKTERSLRKTEIKNFAKSNPLPIGIEIITKSNLQIK